MPEIPLKVMMNVGNPERAFGFALLPHKGIGLARLEFIINDPEADAGGGWISLYPGNDVTPFFGPEPFNLELVSGATATYLSSPIAIPLDLPKGRYRFEAEVYDDTDLTSRAVFIWVDVV